MRRSPSGISDDLPTNCSAILRRLSLVWRGLSDAIACDDRSPTVRSATSILQSFQASQRARCLHPNSCSLGLQCSDAASAWRAAASSMLDAPRVWALLPAADRWHGGTDDRRFPAPLHAA